MAEPYRLQSGAPLVRPTMPELDSVRGLAVLMVVVYHAMFWSSDIEAVHGATRWLLVATQPGWLGVQLFFVLSGFLITGILVDSHARPDYYRRFYTRRALRILPAYIALLGVLAVAGIARLPFVVTALLFAANLTPVLGVPMQYGPLWSLAVEEQFYLLWPFTTRRLSRRGIAALATAIVLVTPVLRMVAFRNGWTTGLYSYTWFVADGLALGALLAIVARSAWATRARMARLSVALVATGGAVIAAGVPYGILHRDASLGAALQLAPFHLVFAGVIGLALVAGTGAHARLVTPGWLRYFGRISYGLYLYHVLAFVAFDIAVRRYAPALGEPWRTSLPWLLLRFAVAGGLAVAVAAISREYFEERFLRMKGRERPRAVAPEPEAAPAPAPADAPTAA